MSVLAYILIFSFIGSVVSLVGGIILLSHEDFARRISRRLAAFAAGTLLGTAFLDLLPEAWEASRNPNLFVWALSGLLGFFLLERFVLWFHHHHPHEHEHHGGEKHEATVALIVLGDTVHNFIDGVVIAGTFLVSIPLGIVTSLAVAAHEIPQEIGDFGILLHRGLPRKKILMYNLMSAAATIVAAVSCYLLGSLITSLLPMFLSITAGFFIYIAASDIIPEIHNTNERKFAILDSSLLLAGVAVVAVSMELLHH